MAASLGAFLSGTSVLEPVNDIVDVEWLAASARVQGVQLNNVRLNLLSRGVRVLLEPALQLRQLHLRVEAGAHPGLLVRVLRVHRLQGRMDDHVGMRRVVIVEDRLTPGVQVVKVWRRKVQLSRLRVDEGQNFMRDGIRLRR